MDPPCEHCTGACCVNARNSTYKTIVRLETPEERERFASVAGPDPDLDEEDYVGILTVAGRCPFLGEDNRCSVYAERPQACREFTCVAGYDLQGRGCHGFFLEDHPEVVELIELHVLRR